MPFLMKVIGILETEVGIRKMIIKTIWEEPWKQVLGTNKMRRKNNNYPSWTRRKSCYFILPYFWSRGWNQKV